MKNSLLLTRNILKQIIGYNDNNYKYKFNGIKSIINYMITTIDQIHINTSIPQLITTNNIDIKQNNNEINFDSIFDGILYMGVPKSKVSPSRKRMKHLQHVPDKIGWLQCKKCGEPKRPHRICTKHIDICAMRDDEYEATKKNLKNN